MNWAPLLRVLFLTTVIVLLAASLLAILLTGPVVVRTPVVHLDIEASPERLRQTVETLCTDLAPRDYRHIDNLDRAARWIAEALQRADVEVEVQDYRVREGLFHNVIARRRGTDPSLGAIVIGAHYDAYGGFPGADDNASGVAVLLELVRTLPAGRAPRRSQIFAAFSTQEPPFFGSDDMGSYAFARQLVAEHVQVELMIALDLVGYYRDEEGSQRLQHPFLRLLYPDRGNFIAVIGDLRSGPWIDQVKRGVMSTTDLPVHSFRAPASLAPVQLSDHFSFRRLGLPGVLVTDTAFMRFPHYHTRDDTPDKLDYERMAKLVLGLHGVLAEAPQR